MKPTSGAIAAGRVLDLATFSLMRTRRGIRSETAAEARRMRACWDTVSALM